ncbi:proteasome subunit beta [Candidatus Geothermarchaeota archaeon ex4572_27]|nr:MAG: proteasome subunit beta [Candidatus Geothermarchaeota archaeon ex4572_27]
MYAPGATAVGLKTRDVVVLAAEKRMTYGSFLVTRHVKKVFRITDRVGAAAAGLIADMQELFRYVSALIRLREMDTGKRANVRSVAKLTSTLLYSHKLYPYYTQVIIGGVIDRPELYSLDPLGSLIEDNYIVVGTGTEVAIGLLETEYREDLGREEAADLVVRSIKAAIGRDVLSGDGVDMLIIDRNGCEERALTF